MTSCRDADIRRSAGGGDELDFDAFYESIFDLASMWVATAADSTFALFLRSVFNRIAWRPDEVEPSSCGESTPSASADCRAQNQNPWQLRPLVDVKTFVRTSDGVRDVAGLQLKDSNGDQCFPVPDETDCTAACVEDAAVFKESVADEPAYAATSTAAAGGKIAAQKTFWPGSFDQSAFVASVGGKHVQVVVSQ